MEQIEGLLLEITFSNDTNGFTVGTISYEGAELTIVGCLPGILVGETLKLTGTFTEHPDYGEQFKVSSFEITAPQEEGAILLFLSSGVIHGVGDAMARRIVKHFGKDTLHIIEHQKERLTEISGIGANKANQIHESFLENMELRSVMMFFRAHGITTEMAMKVYHRLGSDCVIKAKQNPYYLFENVSGFSFTAADKLASLLQFPHNFPERISGGIVHVLLSAAMKEGHTCLPQSRLIAETVYLLGVTEDEVIHALSALLVSGKVLRRSIANDQFYYLYSFFDAEETTARHLKALASNQTQPPQALDSYIEEIENEINIQLSEEQKEAVYSAAIHNVLVITGGPGTGKTTIIRAILALFKRMELRVALAAPTGRAAKKMSDVTGHEAKTIHRLLELAYADGDEEQFFMRDESYPLEIDALIVDEMSMVDISLMGHMLRALPPGCRLILVGDADQLPSVGPGTVLKDILSADTIPSIRLHIIFRQAAMSMIVQNAHKINHGEMPLCNESGTDFFFLERNSPESITDTILELVTERLPKAYGFSPGTDIQILTPVKKTTLGVTSLCTSLQKKLNPKTKFSNETKYGNLIFRTGDRVMQIKNDYEITWSKPNGEEGVGVFNGDIGTLEEIDELARTFRIVFDDERTVIYPFNKLEMLTLAYAITVHKSQGSEFDCLVMPVFLSSPKLQTRNLFYTAVTRAKKIVVLVGSRAVMMKMVQNDYEALRYGTLKELLL